MKITFKKLTIQNFKGVLGTRTIEFNPQITHIMGANHTGKTTVVDAVLWLLFNKNSAQSAVFGISPKDEHGEIIPNLENSVELVMEVDGKETILKKTRREVRAKARGEEEKLSYPCAYFINGAKTTERDFKAHIEITENLFKALTAPDYFPNLQAIQQRMLLVKMIEEPTMNEVAAGNQHFQEILEEMNGQQMQQYRQTISYNISKVKEELKDIPSRINELTLELTELRKNSKSEEELAQLMQDVNQEIQRTEDELTDISRTADREYEKRYAERVAINNLHEKMKKMVNQADKKQADEQDKKNLTIKMVEQALRAVKRDIEYAEKDVNDLQKHENDITIKAHKFREKWHACEAEEYTWLATDEYCKTCGQKLPENEIDNLRKAAEERFAKSKMQQQDQLDKEAAGLKEEKVKVSVLLNAAKTRLETLQRELAKRTEELQQAYDITVTKIDVANTNEYKELEQEIERRTRLLEETPIGNCSKDAVEQVRTRRQELQAKRDAYLMAVKDNETIKRIEQRISILEIQRKNLLKQLDELQAKEYHSMQLLMKHIAEVESRVNKLFHNLKFKMFKKLLNGNIEPTCECTMHGTPYQDLSNSEKINAGIEIINAMCIHNQTWVPCFIDNAECINDVVPMKSQQILLIVSRDKELTIIR